MGDCWQNPRLFLLLTMVSPKVMGLLAEHINGNPRIIGSDRGVTFRDNDASSSDSELGDILVTATPDDDD